MGGCEGIVLRGGVGGDYLPRLHWIADALAPPTAEPSRTPAFDLGALLRGRRQHPVPAIIEELRATYEAGDWRVLPNYPRGHVQILEHLPWHHSFFAGVGLTTCVLLLQRQLTRRVAAPLGRKVGRMLHGSRWLDSA